MRYKDLTMVEKIKVYQEFLNRGNYDTFEGFCKMNRNTIIDNLNIIEISWK
jgi:hypothetical protein